MSKILNIENSLEVLRLYLNGTNQNKIEDDLGVTVESIVDALKYHKIPIRGPNDLNKKEMNEGFFEKIDTEEKAYFLGWMYSDGNISKNLKSASLVLCKKDINILEILNDLIYPTKEFYIYRDYNVCLHLSRKKVVNDLINLGCVVNKSLILKFPTKEQVPEKFLSHFIRGYFDGDGSFFMFSNQQKSRFGSKITSTKNFCEGVGQYIKKQYPDIKYSFESLNNFGTVSMHFGQFSSIKLGDIMYRNCKIKLERKYKKFIEMVNSQKNKIYHPKKLYMKDKKVEELVGFYLNKESSLSQ